MNTRDNNQLLKVADLHVHYGRIAALKGVSLGVSAGEIVAVLGANGAGKSTLMKALAGLVPVRKGEIRFLGEPIVRLNAHKRSSIGMSLVPEGRMVFAPLTVRENLRLGMLSDKWVGGGGLFQERLERVFELFPALRNRLRTPAGDLSGGQQQMVVIGRALMSDPKVLLLDEPSLGLAPRVIEDLFETILTLNEEHGVTVLLTEQSIDNALAIADRAYVFQVGEVILSDSAEALLERSDVENVYLGRSLEYGGQEENKRAQ
jgi:branched-chain amino acid transport system ATP-binding protein